MGLSPGTDRDFDATTSPELAGKTLKAGVWAGPDKSPLWIGRTLTHHLRRGLPQRHPRPPAVVYATRLA